MHLPDHAPDYTSILNRELLAASPALLRAVAANEELGVYILHESITLTTNGNEEQKKTLKDMATWRDWLFCDYATHVYEEFRYRHNLRGDSAPMPVPHDLLSLIPMRCDIQANFGRYEQEPFDRVVQCVQLEHARRLLNMTSIQELRRLAPTVETLVEGVQKHDLLPFIKRLTSLVWKEGFQWQPKNESSYSALFTLYQCMIAATSKDRDRELYRYLISLQGSEARIAMDAIQLLLDFTVHFDDSSLQTRMALLHALYRLAGNSGLYPAVLTHKPVKAPDSHVPIGEGSFGKVFTVEEEGRVLALKVSHRNLSAKTFCKEVITWCNLSHGNVLPFYGAYFNPREGQYTLVSPSMTNGSVRKYLNENYPRVEGPRVLLISDIVSGLEYIHRMGVIHGDLKADNILVSDSGRACLADFGISTVSTDANHQLQLTLPSTALMGTAAYQAPELLNCADVNARLPLSDKSDVYAFGCVCYEMMTMKPPFWDYHTPNVMISVVQGKRPTKPGPTELAFTNLGLTDPLWALMEDCWHEIPHQRPTARHLQQHRLLANLRDGRLSNLESGELTAAQTRQNKMVISLQANWNNPSTMSSMYTSCTSYR